MEGPRSEAKLLAKTRDLSPWFYRKNAAIAVFLRQYGGATRRSSTRGLVCLLEPSFAYKNSCIDLRRVALSCLLEPSFAYKNPCRGLKRKHIWIYASIF